MCRAQFQVAAWGVFVCLLSLLAAAPAGAQWPATLGIYDDAAMTSDHGNMDGFVKEVFLGLSFPPPDSLDGMSGLEFSISGLEPFVLLAVEWLAPPTVVLGTFAAPADTVGGTGGVDVAWSRCFLGNRVVAKLVLAAAVPPQDHVLRVQRRYPPSNSQLPYACALPCDSPCFGCHYRLTRPPYVLNPNIGVEPRTWGAIKRLYAVES